MWKAYPAMGAFPDFPRSGLNLRCTRAFADLGDGLSSPLIPVQTIESEPVTVSRLSSQRGWDPVLLQSAEKAGFQPALE
jgi:hypothetical protein